MRSRYTMKNSIIGLVSLSVVTVLAFLARSVIADELGQSAIGLIALYSDLFILLNFLRFGIEPGFLASLYAPVREGDQPRIRGLVHLFQRLYARLGLLRLAAAGLVAVGLAVSAGEARIGIYFFLIAGNYTLVHFFHAPLLVVHADQQVFYLSQVRNLALGLMAFLRILFIPLFPDFLTYVLTHTAADLVLVLLVQGPIRRRVMPPPGPVADAKGEWPDIRRRMKGFCFHSLQNVLETGVNNLYVVLFAGLARAGAFASYGMIVLTLNRFTDMLFTNVTASVGDLLAEGDAMRALLVHRALSFLSVAVGTAVALGFANVVEPFMVLWLGPTYLLSDGVRFGFAAFYLLGVIAKPSDAFKTARGLFYEDRFVPVLSAVLNVGLCLWLGWRYGVEGILAANLISMLAIAFWQKTWMVYRHVFFAPFSRYLADLIPWLCAGGASAWLSARIIGAYQPSRLLVRILLDGSVSVGVPLILFGLLFFASEPVRYILELYGKNGKKGEGKA